MVDLNKSQMRIFVPAIALATSFYYSAIFTLAMVLGYLGSKLFYNVLVKRGTVDSIYIDMGDWKFHLHHWIMGAVVLGVAWIIRDFHLSAFFTGVMCGIIVHDIYDFNDWYKVVWRVKNEE